MLSRSRVRVTAGLAGRAGIALVAACGSDLYPLVVMGGLVTIVPLIVLFLVLQRYWPGGVLLGSIAN